jgi:hypothetical protein
MCRAPYLAVMAGIEHARIPSQPGQTITRNLTPASSHQRVLRLELVPRQSLPFIYGRGEGYLSDDLWQRRQCGVSKSRLRNGGHFQPKTDFPKGPKKS